MRHAAKLLAVALASTACTGGSVDGGPPPPPRDPPTNLRDILASSRDNPGPTRDTPPNAREGDQNPSQTSASCLPCDTTYMCTTVIAGKAHTSQVPLTMDGGECKSGSDTVINCDGTIVSTTPQGTSVYHWTPFEGGFVVTEGGTTCVPAAAPSSGTVTADGG